MSNTGYFVDTNVIIDFIKKTDTKAVNELKQLLMQDDVPLAINRIVFMEILRAIPKSEDGNFINGKNTSRIFPVSRYRP